MRTLLHSIKKREGFSHSSIIIYSCFIFLLFSILYLDIYGYYITKSNLKQAVDETLTLMKFENGCDNNTRVYFNNMAGKLGLNINNITGFYGTPKTVQRGDNLELEAVMKYEVQGLRLLRPDNKIVINIKVHAVGLAHKKIR